MYKKIFDKIYGKFKDFSILKKEEDVKDKIQVEELLLLLSEIGTDFRKEREKSRQWN